MQGAGAGALEQTAPALFASAGENGGEKQLISTFVVVRGILK